MNEASRITRESFDTALETGAETIRGVQEGFASNVENVRDLNVWRRGTPMLLSTSLAKLQRPKRRRIWSTPGQHTRPNSSIC